MRDEQIISQRSALLSEKIKVVFQREARRIAQEFVQSQKAASITGGIMLDLGDLKESTGTELEQTFLLGATSAAERIGAGLFDQVNQEALNFATDRAAELITGIEEWTREQINLLIQDAFADGLTSYDISSAIEDSYAFSSARAQMIADTEIAYAQCSGAMAQWKESGAVDGKQWLLGSEHDNEDACDENEAAGPIAIDADFPSGDEAPPAHPNCHCDIAAVINEEEETA